MDWGSGTCAGVRPRTYRGRTRGLKNIISGVEGGSLYTHTYRLDPKDLTKHA